MDCTKCGACCAYFRVLLNSSETDESYVQGVPVSMTVKISEYMRVMKGTENAPARCTALEGDIGKYVFCGIYEQRCSACRDFNPTHEDGEPNEACEEARALHKVTTKE